MRRLGVALGLSALCMLGCGGGGDPTLPQPNKVYRDGFETPLDAVTIEAHGGTIIGAYDAWLIIAGDTPPRPADDGDYRPIDCAPIEAYFQRELALEDSAIGVALVDCVESTNERLPFDNGRWLARSPAGGRLFYRVWKYPSPR